ncbi:type VI secretion system baseplate subunit TssF [Roseateles flavus]|uniref:Type VI secretion system baseplate subunit TssF n=1 Tax=Roseateles flavus TaxID=3149041 RepID=A0ABV0G8Y9_9BURK
MDDLLPYFEQELAFLRRQGESFARQYPKLAGRLTVSGDLSDDPHVERMIQSFALLSARAHKRLDDDFPLFTETLLDVLYPHYLRPFPSCAIAQLEPAPGAMLPAGAVLQSRQVQGVNCRFRSTHVVQSPPVRLSALRFSATVHAPLGTRLPPQLSAMLSLTLQIDPSWQPDEPLPSRLRVYIDGESATVCALRHALCQQTRALYLQQADREAWACLGQGEEPDWRPRLAGFAPEEALLPPDSRSSPAYRLLTEYLAFPQKFQFVDLPLQRCHVALRSGRPFTLHFLLGGLRADGEEARLLDGVGVDHLQLGCVPVVNLFEQHADPVRVDHRQASYSVLPDARRAACYEVYSLSRVQRVRKTEQGEQVQTLRPFYGLGHSFESEAGEPGLFYHLQRDSELAKLSPGHELQISLVDPAFDPAVLLGETLSIDVLATNRELPTLLLIGQAGGDLTPEGGGSVRGLRLRSRPTAPLRFTRQRGTLWRLISHLSLNHLSLSEGGIEALKDMLRLYDLPRSPVNRRLIDALQAVRFEESTAWMPGKPFASFVRGLDIELLIDEDGHVGTGMELLAHVLDHFFALFAHVNSFTRLRLRGHRSKELLFSFPARSGWHALL